MTTDVHHPFDVRNRDYLRPPTVHERTESLSRARSHSKLVSRLRIILPALAAGTFALYFFSPEIRVSLGDMDASVAGVVIDKGNLRMLNPKLEGVNEKQGAYVVTAKYAEQAVANPDVIYLTELTAETDSSAKGWSRLTAPKGIFETKTEKLNLTGDIRVSQSNGMTARLTSADLDTKAELITSDEPVKIDFSGGKLDASTMRINMDVKEVRFIGDVHVLLLRQPKDPAEQKPAEAGSTFAAAIKSDAPVDIYAPKLTIYDTRKLAHFEGGVTADQAGSRMISREMRVIYESKAAEGQPAPQPAEAGSGAKLKTIDAIGDVHITSTDGRRATAATLHYDSAAQKLTLDGGVMVAQADNVLRGKRMITDLATGITRFPPLERVRGHFKPAEAAGDEVKQVVQTAPAAIEAGGATHIDLSSTRGKPIDIEADTLTVNDKTRVALFEGKVHAVQGTMTMRSSNLAVNYSGGGADAQGKESGSKITSIRAEGRVLINTAADQATTSDWAVFDAASQTVTIGGNVVLSQGDNVIKGDELVIDLTTNRSRFVNRGDPLTRKRVRGLFMPKKSGAQ